MTLDDIGQKIMEALRDSTGIASACDTAFDKPHSVFYAVAGSKSPDIADFPAFVIVPSKKSTPENASIHSFEFFLGLAISDDSITEDTTEDGVVTKVMSGATILEDLLDLAATEIRGISANIDISSEDFEIEPVEFFPTQVGSLRLVITIPVLIGGTVSL